MSKFSITFDRLIMALPDLYISLKNLGLVEASDVLSIIKESDSRGSIVRILGFSKEDADFFNSLSPQKAFDLARWFKEWWGEFGVSWNERNSTIQKAFRVFSDHQTIQGDPEYNYDPTTYDFVDYILSNDSLYQKVKRKSLKDALTVFEAQVLMERDPGPSFYKYDKDLEWHNVGQECDITSAFLHNCGSLGDFGPEGDYFDNTDFTMMVLKDKTKRPLMVVTYGTVKDKDDNFQNVIINAAEKLNKFPTTPDYLDAMFYMAGANNIKFAILLDKDGEVIPQTPGLQNKNGDVIKAAGFDIIQCHVKPNEDLMAGEMPHDDWDAIHNLSPESDVVLEEELD